MWHKIGVNRPSRVLTKLRSGRVAISVKLNLADQRAALIASQSGYDCLWLDHEHVPNSIQQTESMIHAGLIYDVDSLVRVRKGCYSDFILPLEMGAAGIMIPHVMSVDEAKEIVYQTRFHPIGRRAWDGGNADGGFCEIAAKDYMRQSNENRFVILQIEDPEVMPDIEKIAALDGVDMLLFGPGDYSQAIGEPGNTNHPEVVEARERVVSVCEQYHKFAGTVGTLENLPGLLEMGYQFVNVGADVVALTAYFKQITQTIASDLGYELSGSAVMSESHYRA
ncbi:HpcH/HpaI aldolase family protein [Poriferisphaera sp. WC338]|uniref:HpcH/HpaI aldolase family protein n=1 Tax=Poriferisphaera sp. WC338 TaxID=3425129 RepID=UPI003D816C49